jgi:hypothetical protein
LLIIPLPPSPKHHISSSPPPRNLISESPTDLPIL